MTISPSLPAEALEDPDSSSVIIEHNGHSFDCAIQALDWVDLLTPQVTAKMGRILSDALDHEDIAPTEIALLFTSDDAVATLNKTHRDKDGATDVLSFPADEDDFLGDIALAFATMKTQAEELDISLEDHVLHLALHGTLHLCGHDHIDDDDAEVMEAIEIKILAKHGIANPYVLPANGRASSGISAGTKGTAS